MSLHRLKAAVVGLVEAGRVNEWVVTEKLGDALKPKLEVQELGRVSSSTDPHEPLLPIRTKPSPKRTFRFWKRYTRSRCTVLTFACDCNVGSWARRHLPELGWGILLICCGMHDMLVTKRKYFLYVLPQGIAFLVTGFDYVGTHVPPP